MKQIPFDEFDGGIMDEDVPGERNRYATCDNLLIDHSKKLISRDGFDIFSSTAYQLTASERVARLHSFDSNSELLAFQAQKAWAISSGAWSEVTGPAGGHAFNTATASHLVEAAEWQHHLFAASSAGDPVIKMYRDSGGTMRLRTAGLPEFPTAIQSDVDGGLARAITLANDIRTKMIAHFGANTVLGTGTPSNGATDHHFAHADLAAQKTAVSGSTAATNLASLITLVNLLRTQYSAHIADAQKEDNRATPTALATAPFRNYHMTVPAGTGYYAPHISGTSNQPLYMFRHYLNLTIGDPAYSIPSSAAIADVLPYLNDLRDKWNWHTYAPMTHYNAAYWLGNNYFTYLGSHATAVDRVETYTWAQITPNYGPFIQFVKDLKTEFDAHRLNDMHMEHDTVWVVPSGVSSSPTTFQDAVTLLGWLSYCITYHALEPDTSFCANGSVGYDANVTATTTSGTATLTLSTGGASADQYKYLRVVPMIGLLTTPFAWGLYLAQDQTKLYNVTTSDTATPTVLTCANNFTASYSSKQFVLTARHYHMGTASASLFDHRTFAALWDAQDFMLGSAASLQGVADVAKLLASYLKAHTIDRLTAIPSTGFSKYNANSKSYQLYSNSLATFSATGYDILVHAGMDNTNFAASSVTGTGGLYLSLSSAILSSNTAATQLAEDRFGTSPTAKSFNYKACFRYDYTVGTKSFTDRSATSSAINVIGFLNEDNSTRGSTEKGKFAASITNFYAYALASNENWAISDTTNFRKEIYRSLGDSTAGYYRVDIDGVAGDVSNATTSFDDYTSDTWLPDQLALYTNSGAPDNNKPPSATGVHIFKNNAYYVSGNKVYQSIPSDPDSVPGEFYEEFPEDIVGVSSTKTVAVAFGSEAVYRLVGGFDDLGRGSLTFERIFNRTGAISSQSIVKANDGIFFAGKDGFYFTDGYQCVRATDIIDPFVSYTNTTAKQKAIQGAYDRVNKKLYYTLITGSGSNPDKIWVIDIKFGVRPDLTPVTTLSKTTGFNPTALAFYGDALHYGDGDGYVFKQTLNRGIDLVKDTSVAATLWDAETIIWRYKSCHDPYGTEGIRKFFQRVTCQFDMRSTNVSCQINSDADKGRIVSALPVIRSRKLTDWGDSKIDWVSAVYPAKAGNLVDSFRWLNGDGSLRSNFRAFEFTNAYCVIVKSDDMGTITLASVSSSDWTATLTSLVATRKWPLYSVGYFLRIGGVDYPVTARTSDSVIHVNPTGLTALTAGVPASWELWGYPKNERIRFMGFTVNVDVADDMQSASQGTVVTGGQNA